LIEIFQHLKTQTADGKNCGAFLINISLVRVLKNYLGLIFRHSFYIEMLINSSEKTIKY